MLTLERPSDAPAPARPGLIRRLWALPLGAHVAALALLLVALAPIMHLGTSFTSDEGAYALQVRALDDGTWAYDYGASALDPDRRWVPLVKADLRDGAVIPYGKHPGYVRALQLSTRLLGEDVGLVAWSLLGALGVAAACWLLAATVAPGAERAAFWIGATGPALVNGYLGWAHGPAAALAGVAVVAAARVAAGGLTGPRLAVLVAATGAGVFLRSEMLLFGAALIVVLAAVLWARSRRGAALVVALAGGAALALALAAEMAWQRSVLGTGYTEVRPRSDTAGAFAGRVGATWHVLVDGAVTDATAALLSLLAVCLAVTAAVLLVRRRPDAVPVAVAALGGAAALVVARALVQPDETVTGLFAAWPVAGFGVVAALVCRRHLALLPLVVGVIGLFGAAVLATQYAEGGGWEWGGRFLAPALVPLAVLAAAGVCSVPTPVRRAAGVLAVAGAVSALTIVASSRSGLERFFLEVERAGAAAPLAVTTYSHLPRAMWSADDRLRWMVASGDDLPLLLDDIDGDVAELMLVVGAAEQVDTGAYTVADVTGPAAASRGTRVLLLDRR